MKMQILTYIEKHYQQAIGILKTYLVMIVLEN